MDATASRILDVYSTPRGEKRADVENTRKTENRCNRCWKDGGDVKRGGRGEVGTDEVEKGTEGNEENRRQRERERERGGKKKRRKKKKKKADSNLYQPLGETPAGGKISSAFEKRGSGEVY